MKTTNQVRFPTTVIDNFYENPDEIRKMALEMEYDYDDHNWSYPGKRTKPLHLINDEFFQYSCAKMISTFFNEQETDWRIKTQFQLIEPFGDKGSVVDRGWIHQDHGNVLAAVVYLTPEADPDTGTSIYHCKEDDPFTDKNQDIRSALYDPNKNFEEHSEEYEETKNYFDSKFVETVKVSNVYNRAIVFDANSYHGVPSYSTGTDSRLTQVFFVQKLESPLSPIERINNLTLM